MREGSIGAALPFNKEAVGKFVRDTRARLERIRAGKQAGHTAQEERQVEGVRGLSIVVKPSGTASFSCATRSARAGGARGAAKHWDVVAMEGFHSAKRRTMALARMADVAKGGDPVAEERKEASARPH